MKSSYKYLIAYFLIYGILQAQDYKSIAHADWSRNASIYEVNIRQYTPEGTFKAFEKHLPELKKLGVDILWLMPINPIGVENRKGSLGSYYSVQDYTAVNPEFGTIDDLKSLVAMAHKLGMKVIVDWVANHTAWDNVWVKEHPDFYTRDAKGNFVPPVADWSDVIDLNYDNKELREHMIDAMEFWVKECDIDGYRCDVAAMVPIDFWVDAIAKLNKIKKVFMLAEASENYLHAAFDMTYNWQLKDLMNDIAKGKKSASDLVGFFKTEAKEYKPDDYRMNFTTNHDENTWNGTVFERLDGGVAAFAVLCGTAPGMPLIYSGQEAGLDKRLRFFDKDTIQWKSSPLRKIYTALNGLKEKNKALWNGESGGELISVNSDNNNVFAFTRSKNSNKIFAVFNFSGKPQQAKLEGNEMNGKYSELFGGKKITIGKRMLEVNLKPWEYRVYYK